jgi:hypothetical protein
MSIQSTSSAAMLYQRVRLDETEKMSNDLCRTLYLTRGEVKGNTHNVIGIDPGVNFGMTFIRGKNIAMWHGALNPSRLPGQYGLLAYQLLQSFDPEGFPTCVIEGAAFHKTFGQVGLAEVRIGFYIAAAINPFIKQVSIVPPATIRKTVFGDGRAQAGDAWPTHNHNGCDSLSIALYGLY